MTPPTPSNHGSYDDEVDRVIEEVERLPGVRDLYDALERAERRRGALFRQMVSRRHRLRLSQANVAGMMGTSQPALARLEGGMTDPKLSTLERYAAAIGTELHFVCVPDASQAGHRVRRLSNSELAVTKRRAKQVLDEVANRGAGTSDRHPREMLVDGWLFQQRGDLERARKAYERVIESRDPDAGPEALRNLGLVLEKQGDFERALAAYERAEASGHPNAGPRAGLNLGWLLAQLGDLDAGATAYRRVIASEHPDHAPTAQVNLALLLERLGRLDEARALLETVTRTHGHQGPRAMRHLALLLEKQGMLDDARLLLEQVIRTDHPRQSIKASADLKHLQEKLGHWEEAAYESIPQTPLERIISEGPETADPIEAVRRQLDACDVVALGEPVGRQTSTGPRVERSVTCFAVNRYGTDRLTIPVFTRDALLVPALVRNPEWLALPVVRLQGRQLLSELQPGESVVINPWTPLEYWISSAQT